MALGGDRDGGGGLFTDDRSGRLKLLGVAVVLAAAVALTFVTQGDSIEVWLGLLTH